MSRLRTLLVLGRVSNLPTVWSNCAAGWWLGGHSHPEKFALIIAGASFLYLGGMFLNDVFDTEFDRQYRKERPIPAGAISSASAWRWGLAWLVIGMACLFFVGTLTGILGALLACCIVAYDVVHKVFVLSPLLMAACRFLLYPLAASGAAEGVTGSAVWCGLALGCYIAGLSFAARNESARRSFAGGSFSLLGIPILFALFMNAGPYREPALLASAILLLWIIRSLRPALWSQDRNIGRTVAALIAGIPLVDLIATVDAPRPVNAIFLVLFVLSLAFQKFIPAT